MKKIVIVDIDGTLTVMDKRLEEALRDPNTDLDKLYKIKDKLNFTNEPKPEIIELVHLLSWQYEIVFCTGRRCEKFQETSELLLKFFGLDFGMICIMMRKNDDYRPDSEVKPSLLKLHNIELENIAFVLEDRVSVVKAWRDLGLTCLQVAPGDF